MLTDDDVPSVCRPGNGFGRIRDLMLLPQLPGPAAWPRGQQRCEIYPPRFAAPALGLQRTACALWEPAPVELAPGVGMPPVGRYLWRTWRVG
jgi:hypothetical protein